MAGAGRRRQAGNTADQGLARLYKEPAALPCVPCDQPVPRLTVPAAGDVVVPLRYRVGDRPLSFISIIAVLGTPMDVTLAKMAIEAFHPADTQTAGSLNRPA